MGAVIIGVDIGQKRDPTAICVAEEDRRDLMHYTVRHLARLPLGTPYPEVVQRLAEICAGVERQAGRKPLLYVDATGVGQPIVDELRVAKVRAGIAPVYFTHGDRRVQNGLEVTLGKAFLVSRLQVLLQGHRLHLPRIPEAEVLSKELLDYEIQVSEDANDRYGAFRVGTHDDLVTALGLAVHHERPRWGIAA